MNRCTDLTQLTIYSEIESSLLFVRRDFVKKNQARGGFYDLVPTVNGHSIKLTAKFL